MILKQTQAECRELREKFTFSQILGGKEPTLPRQKKCSQTQTDPPDEDDYSEIREESVDNWCQTDPQPKQVLCTQTPLQMVATEMLRRDFAPSDLWRRPLSVDDFNLSLRKRLNLDLLVEVKLKPSGLVHYSKLK